MTDLVACLSTGKGTWGPVTKLVNSGKFDKIYLLTNQFGSDNFTKKDNVELIVIDGFPEELELKEKINQALKGKLQGEVAINLTSGSGREHMALLSALLQLGVGIRLVVPGDNELIEL